MPNTQPAPPSPFARHQTPASLQRAALVAIDMQRAFTSPTHPAFVADTPAALCNLQRLIEAFRAANRPIVYSRHAHLHPPSGPGMGRWWSHFIIEDTDDARLDPRLTPRLGELVVRKEHYSAFRETELEPWLRKREVDTIVLAGTMTHICVDTTARDAFMRGFDVVIAVDACASKDRALHESALLGLSHAVARVAPAQALVHQLGELP